MKNKNETELLNIFLKASKNEKLLGSFMKEILTPAEIKEISTRIQVMKRLIAGEPQRSISSKLKIGIATVTRGSRALSSSSEELIKLLTKK